MLLATQKNSKSILLLYSNVLLVSLSEPNIRKEKKELIGSKPEQRSTEPDATKQEEAFLRQQTTESDSPEHQQHEKPKHISKREKKRIKNVHNEQTNKTNLVEKNTKKERRRSTVVNELAQFEQSGTGMNCRNLQHRSMTKNNKLATHNYVGKKKKKKQITTTMQKQTTRVKLTVIFESAAPTTAASLNVQSPPF